MSDSFYIILYQNEPKPILSKIDLGGLICYNAATAFGASAADWVDDQST